MPVAQWLPCDVSTQVKRLRPLSRGLVTREEEEGAAAPAEPRERGASDAHIAVEVAAAAAHEQCGIEGKHIQAEQRNST